MDNEERIVVRKKSSSSVYKDVSIAILCNVLTIVLLLIIVASFINVYKLS